MAQTHPGQDVIFLGVGFETTAPVIALAVKEAFQTGCENFSVLPALKILDPILRVLLTDPQLKIDGLIAPGHLSVITGARALEFLPLEYHLPTVITGFQTEEIWLGLWALMRQIKAGDARLENQYSKAVSWEGNPAAQKLIQEIFMPETTEWRGMGRVENSGLGLRAPYQKFDARIRFRLEEIPSDEPPCCLCGLILTGKAEPEECSHFGRSCTPERPVGPCMVSSEGTCAAHFNYQKWTSNKL
jgi:hydrogenase expression/formation protein HypD